MMSFDLKKTLICHFHGNHFFSIQVRIKAGNKDFHYTTWTILPDRFTDEDLNSLSDEKIQFDVGTKIPTFYCNPEEDGIMRYS